MVYRIYALLCVLAVFAVSCGSEGKQGQEVTEENIDEIIDVEIEAGLVEKNVDKNLDYVIENLRTSDEIIKSVALYKDLYDQDLLNSPDNEKNYITSQSRAANLGVYGAELNYIIHHTQTNSSFKYLIVAKKIADELGVALAFDEKVLEKFKNNTEHKDTLVNLVNSAYSNVKRLLTSSEQFQLASLVIAGSWMENIYLVSESVPNVPDAEIKTALIGQVWDQKEYLDTLIELLNAFEDQEFVVAFADKLKVVRAEFDKEPSEENMASLKEKLIDLRADVIQNN